MNHQHQHETRNAAEIALDHVVRAVAEGRVPSPVTRAKMRCNSITKSGNEKFPSVQICLGAVYSNDPESENRSFANATPSAEVRINIDAGRPAAGAFDLGKEYYVDFIPCEVPELKYIKDGIPDPSPITVMLSNREGTMQARASFTGNQPQEARLMLDIDGDASKRIVEYAYNPIKIMEAGFTHWRYLREEEKAPD